MKENNVAFRREFLEKLSTTELDGMLQKELQNESIDDNLVRMVLSVLEERERNWPIEFNDEIAADIERFENSINVQRGAQAKSKLHWTLKVASVLLVVGLLLFVAPQAVHAESLFEMLARWTDSIFEFFDPREDNEKPEYAFETDHPGLQQIYDAVAELGVTDPVVPMWIPTGYELQSLQVLDQSTDTVVSAELIDNDKYIFFSVILHDKEEHLSYEKDADSIEIVELVGVQHYIMSNIEARTVTWVIDRVECSIFTNCQEEELHSLLKSIYKVGE